MNRLFLVPASGLTFLALSAAGAGAQTIAPLVLEGDNIAGIGLVTGIQRVAINDAGQWLVEVDTDNANTAIDEVLLKGGLVYQQQGQLIAQPAGATHSDFTSQSLRANGDVCALWSLTGTAGGTTDNMGLYFNQQLVLQKGATPLSGTWGAGTTYSTFSWAQWNANNQVLLRGFATDPVSTPTNDWYASILQFDGSGNLLSENVLARAGQILPGQTFGVNTVSSNQDGGAINASGAAIYRVSLSGAPAGADAAVYLWDGVQNVLLATEGSPSPVAARNWGDLVAPELTLNDAGDWVIKDLLDSTSTTTQEIIVKNGVKLVQEGDTLPAIPGFTFTTFGNVPVSITAAGNVLWYGDWNNPTTTVDTGIFLDQQLLIQEGVNGAYVGGTFGVFNSLGPANASATAGQNNMIYVSPNGRYVIFSAQVGTTLGAFVLDRFAGAAPLCFGDGTGAACPCSPGAAGNGCANSLNPAGANLATVGVPSVVDDTFVLQGSGVPNGPGLYFQGTNTLGGGNGIVFGDGLRCAGGSVIRLGVIIAASNASQYPRTGIDPAVSVQGFCAPSDVRTYQLWYRDSDPTFCNTASTFNLTNGVLVTWGL